MANNKFLVEDLTQATAVQLSGWTILENNDTTYKYPVSNLSSDIKNQAQAITNGKAIHDYINSISTSLSSDINGSINKLVDGKAVHDYINSISTSLSNDIDGSANKLVDGKAVHDYVNNSINELGLFGQEGEVVYVTPEGTKKQTILNPIIYVCESDDDLTKSRNDSISFETIFNTWEQGDAYTRTAFGYDKDYGKSFNFTTLNQCFDFNTKARRDYIYNLYNNGKISLNEINMYKNEMTSLTEWQPPLSTYDDFTTRQLSNNCYLAQCFLCDRRTDPFGYPNVLTSYSYNESTPNISSLVITQNACGNIYWMYNNKLSSIIQPMNAYGAAYFVSPNMYNEFDITIECYSLGLDDDYVGFTLCKDIATSNGKTPIRIDFIRVSSPTQKLGFETLYDKTGGGYKTYEEVSSYIGGYKYPSWYSQLINIKSFPWFRLGISCWSGEGENIGYQNKGTGWQANKRYLQNDNTANDYKILSSYAFDSNQLRFDRYYHQNEPFRRRYVSYSGC